jgi:uncharacterized protein YqeY
MKTMSETGFGSNSSLQAKPSDFGKVMKEVLAKAEGQTDGSVVSRIVKEELK